MSADRAGLPRSISIAEEVRRALGHSEPVVALESAVITHGLPRPLNVQVAQLVESAVRGQGAIPATIAVLEGKIRVGLTSAELVTLGESNASLKLSRRDFAAAAVKRASGGTTVAGTMFVAYRAGIQVFATGGIGGVHKEDPFDVSADLPTLADTSMIVVCAGAKAILDLPATLEYLETHSVPVIGYRSAAMPAFYSRESGLSVTVQLDSVQAIAEFWQAHTALGLGSAILVTNPIPSARAIPWPELEPIIARASEEAQGQGVRGQALTPFLLNRLAELTKGRSLEANSTLLVENAKLAAQIAVALGTRKRQ